jgi:hypothetical protein
MKFNELAKLELSPILEKYQFELVEENSISLKYKSPKITLFVQNVPFKCENDLFLGRNDGETIEINKEWLETIFNEPHEIYALEFDIFIQQLCQFFKTRLGSLMLSGDAETLKTLEEGKNKIDQEYQDKLVFDQKIKAIDAAWAKQDYKNFIQQFEQLEQSSVSASLALKYKMALKKFNSTVI